MGEGESRQSKGWQRCPFLLTLWGDKRFGAQNIGSGKGKREEKSGATVWDTKTFRGKGKI